MSPPPGVAGGWEIERLLGRADALHHRPWPDPVRRTAWVVRVTRPAVVLGSTQPLEAVDRAALAAAGVDLARRGSGGGAVLLVPGEVAWLDVFVPAGDRLWDHDVGRAFGWLGRRWQAALATGGAGSAVHEGRPVRSRWSDLVCFAGLGTGEVHAGGAKLVGISQRRTRGGARFQCAVHRRWDPVRLASLLALDDRERADLGDDLATAVGTVADPEAVVETVVARLPD